MSFCSFFGQFCKVDNLLAPFVQIFAMTWKPWHIIAALPPTQMVMLPDQLVIITSEGLRASVRARPVTSLPLAMVIVESGPFSAASSQGWTTGVDKAVLSLGAAAGKANAYDISADIAGLSPDPALLTQLVPDGSLPGTIAEIRLRRLTGLDALDEVGDLMHEAVFVADLQARHHQLAMYG